MGETKDIAQVLQTVLGSKEFMIGIMQDMEKYNMDEIEKALALVIKYYITTRDTKTDYTYKEIVDKYERAKEEIPKEIQYENIVKNGFLTHSCNGDKKDRILQYGLNYMGNITDEQTLDEIKRGREKVEILEELMGKSNFIKDYTKNSVYFTSPGTKTIHYASRTATERLYKGPFNNLGQSIVVGETKQEYMLRAIRDNIETRYPNRDSNEYNVAMALANDIAEQYFTKSPGFALLSIAKMKDVPIQGKSFDPTVDCRNLQEHIMIGYNPEREEDSLNYFFTHEPHDSGEDNGLGDLVTIAQYIPDDAIVGFIDVMDEFDIKQLWAQTKGLKQGDLIDYNSCTYRGEISENQQEHQEETRFSLDGYHTLRKEKLLRDKIQLTEEKDKLNKDIEESCARQDDRLRIIEKKAEEETPEGTVAKIFNKLLLQGTEGELYIKPDNRIGWQFLKIGMFDEEPDKKKPRFLAAAIMDFENIEPKDREVVYQIIGTNKTGKIPQCRLNRCNKEDHDFIRFAIEQQPKLTENIIEQLRGQFPKESQERYIKLLQIINDVEELNECTYNPDKTFEQANLLLNSSEQLKDVVTVLLAPKEPENTLGFWGLDFGFIDDNVIKEPNIFETISDFVETDNEIKMKEAKLAELRKRLLELDKDLEKEINDEQEQKNENKGEEEPTVKKEEIQENSSDERVASLNSKKKRIFDEPYIKKEGIDEQIGLSDVLDTLEKSGDMTQLLQTDTSIEQDDLQYQSRLHGVNHTRRVNFFAMSIMNLENITGRDRDIILEIVKNHDIGRVDDFEDASHGRNSVEKIDENKGRLDGFSGDEQTLIKFVIEQHCRSTKQNEESLNQLPEEIRDRYSLVLKVFKDADKLDRVRLDRKGYNLREGLDVTRLSFESSKRLENVAYESQDKLFKILDIEKELRSIQEVEKPEILPDSQEIQEMPIQEEIEETPILEQIEEKITPEEIKETLIPEEIQEELIKEEKQEPQEEQTQDLVGNEGENDAVSCEEWMGRFSSWYNRLEKLELKLKAPFILVRDKIMSIFKRKVKEQEKDFEANKEQGEDKEE